MLYNMWYCKLLYFLHCHNFGHNSSCHDLRSDLCVCVKEAELTRDLKVMRVLSVPQNKECFLSYFFSLVSSTNLS